MAYQNVGTPRFYIDWGEYQKSLGILETGQMDYVDGDNGDIGELVTLEKMVGTIGLDPVDPLMLPVNGLNTFGRITVSSGAPNGAIHEGFPNYVAILNHNFLDSGAKWTTETSSNGNDVYNISVNDSILNSGSESLSYSDWGGNNGCSIIELQNNVNPVGSKFMKFSIASGSSPADGTTFTDDVYLGSISFGRFYDMPHSPDLDLSMEIEFDGYDQVQTMGGSTLTNVRYAGAPWWYDKDGNKVEPWSVGQSTGVSKRNGRRTWNMKFSYISDKEIFASNYMSNTYTENTTDIEADDLETIEGNDTFYHTLDTDNSFVSQVLNKVGNGQKFIFQPDNTANNPSDFAICQLDQDSLSIKQVAFNVYSFSLRIREVW